MKLHPSTTAGNEIIIGYQATGQGNNTAVIGNANVTRVYAAQDEGASIYAAGMESSAGSISIGSTLLDGQTLKLGRSNTVQMIISLRMQLLQMKRFLLLIPLVQQRVLLL